MPTHPLSIQEDYSQAIVIGGSIAGLLAARALADHCEEVTIIERDRLPSDPAPRPGVPQARHSHGVSKTLAVVGESWFPGLGEQLQAAGAISVDSEREICWLAPAALPKPTYPVASWLACSRDLAEWQIRQQVAALPNIHFVEEANVIALHATPDRKRITGVEFRARQSTAHNPTSILQNAQLVVDASGRHSKATQWLAALALSTPSETVVTIQPYTVSSALCAIPGDFAESWKQLTSIPAALELGMSVNLQAIEGQRWIIFVTTSGATRPPTDRQAFLALLSEVEQPLLRKYLSNLQLLSPIAGGGHTTNRWRHYEALSDQPDNFVAMGDAVCVFHPGYGAGMEIAAKEALALADCLEEQRTADPASEARGFARRFQQRIASIIASQWAIETAEGHG